MLVAAPTGAGKTIVGEFAVHLALATGRKAFYTTPIKALSNQKYHDLVRVHGADKVGLLTGDSSVNGEAPVVVMTTEVLRNMMYAGSRTLDGLGYVVMDEVHYLADRFRGAVWEEVIIHLPEHVQVVSLSATVSNAEEFGDWLAEVRGNHEVVVSEHRPVPLSQHVLVGTTMFDLFAGNRVNPDLLAAIRTSEQRGRWDDEPRRGGSGRGGSGRGGPPARNQHGRGEVPAAGRRARLRPRRAARWGRDPGRGHRRARPRRAAARDHLHLQPGRLRGRRQPAARRRHPAHPRARGAAHPAARRGARRVPGRRGPLGAGLLRLRRGALARVRRPPRRDAAAVPRDRRGALHRGPHPGRVRHRDTGARHQHARPHRGAREARQVQRRGARRHHPGRVHPAHRPGRPTRHRRRGARGRAVGRAASTRWPWAGWPPPAPTRCARASGPPTTWRSTSSRQVGREVAREILETSFAQFQADRAVVGIATAVRRNEEGMEGYAEAMHCHLGDFREYAALRRSLADAEKEGVKSRSASRRAEAAVSLEALRIGDVIRIPAGRRAGWAVVVQPARAGKGTPTGPGRRHRGQAVPPAHPGRRARAGRVGHARQGAAELQPEVAEVAPRPRDLAADRRAPRVRGLAAPPGPRR